MEQQGTNTGMHYDYITIFTHINITSITHMTHKFLTTSLIKLLNNIQSSQIYFIYAF